MKEAVITSSVLILCIVLLRKLCKGRISAQIQYMLWLIVAIRLVIPGVTAFLPNLLPESELSIMNAADRVETAVQEYIPQTEQPIQITFPITGLPFLTGTTADGPTSVFLAGCITWSWIDVLKGIWYFGMIVVGVWMCVVNIRFLYKLKKNRIKYEKEGYKLPIYLVKEIASPCLYGWLGHQAVYLPEEIIGEEEKVKHILVHEYCHYKHGDMIWAALRCILVTVYWFHPFVWIAAVLSKQDCELACDEAAIRLLGEEERIAYGKTLVSLITEKTKASDIMCTATTMTAGAKSIKERIRRIAENPHKLVVLLLLVFVVVGIAIVFTFTHEKQYPEGTYLLEGESSLTITTNCFQVTFPKDLSGKVYYRGENGTDIIVYHKDSDREIGRFCMLPYEESIKLVDKQDVALIHEYGGNPALKNYMQDKDSTVTVHEYYSDEETMHEYHSYVEEEKDGFGGVAGTDSNSDETTYIYEEVNPDSIINEGIGENIAEAGGDAAPIPSPEETDYEVTKLPFYEGTEYTAEDVSEESAVYLPNEEIANVAIGAEQPCYLYVPADNTDAELALQEILAELNQELIELSNYVVVLSMNMASVSEVLDILVENRTPFVGDAVKTSTIARALPVASGLSYQFLEMETTTEPYAVTLHYQLIVDNFAQIDADTQFVEAVLMFASIENLESCTLRMKDMDDALSEEAAYGCVEIQYNRADMEELFGPLYQYSAAKSDLTVLYNKVLEYLEGDWEE